MKNFLAGCVAVAGLTLAASASAATFDFTSVADNIGGPFATTAGNKAGGEGTWTQILGSGVGLLDAGISVVGSGERSDLSTNVDAYFDSGSAGLGVCSKWTSAGQCDPANDDNTGRIGGHAGSGFETLVLTFSEAVSLRVLEFVAEGHGNFVGNVAIGVDGGAFSTFDIGALGTNQSNDYQEWQPTAGLLDGTVFRFKYIGSGGSNDPNEFYIGAVTTGPSQTTFIPLPAALPLFGTGLALMGFVGWRRKQAAAA